MKKPRTFKHFPEKSTCPICHKNTDKECFLLPINGTERGGNVEAQPTHLNCIISKIDELQFHPGIGVIYLRV